MGTTSFDVIVIGSGSAGFSAALAARKAGASVLMAEKGEMGGECPHAACVPTKALLAAAKRYHAMQHARKYGIEAREVSMDFDGAMAWRAKAVDAITGGGDRYARLAEAHQIQVAEGEARFISDTVVQVGAQPYVGKAFVIATGSDPFIPPIPGLDTVPYLTFRDAVSLDRLPRKLAVIGGGPVGCELATFYALLGTRVVLFQSAETLLAREDEEIARLAQEAAAENGIEVTTGARVTSVKDAQGGVYGLTVERGGAESTQAADQILVAAGKRPATGGLGLEDIGVKLDARGGVKTASDQSTSAKHIFAAGDVDGGLMFTHTAHYEGTIAGQNAARAALKKRSEKRTADERVVPRVTFVEPEVASVGMTAAEAKAKHRQVLVGRFHTAGLGRAVTEGARPGLVKLVAHPKTGKILGGHIFCDRAGEMIHEVALAMTLGATAEKVAGMIHAYPTFSEAIGAAASAMELE